MSISLDRKNRIFLVLIAFAFLVGVAVAVALCWMWRYHPGTITPEIRVAAVAVCPPFLLAQILEDMAESPLTLFMTLFTIVFANGFLYAGLASFVYFLVTTFLPKRA